MLTNNPSTFSWICHMASHVQLKLNSAAHSLTLDLNLLALMESVVYFYFQVYNTAIIQQSLYDVELQSPLRLALWSNVWHFIDSRWHLKRLQYVRSVEAQQVFFVQFATCAPVLTASRSSMRYQSTPIIFTHKTQSTIRFIIHNPIILWIHP